MPGSLTLLVWITALPALGRVDGPAARAPIAVFGDRATQAAPPAAGRNQAPAEAVHVPTGKGFFLSWGYNGDSYARSDMHFSQPSLSSDFRFSGVKAQDNKGWTSLFDHSLFVPQYNIRLGYFFSKKWGLELALDHIKWIVQGDQQVGISGTLNGVAVDHPITLSADVLKYQLNNGANPVFVNVIRRVMLAKEPGRTGGLSFEAKAGAGFAVPHTENTLFNHPNEPGFQWFHGWNADVGVGLRFNAFRRFYLEFEDKFLFAHYYGVHVDQGTASHSVRANEFIFNFGLEFLR